MPHAGNVVALDTPRPTNVPTLANPCFGVPDNGWWRKGKPI